MLNIQLAEVSIICLGSVIGLAIVGASVVSVLVALKQPEQSTNALKFLVEGGNSIRLLATLIVIIAATFLGLSGALTEGVVALLSSIAGFMLGGVKPRVPASDRR